MPPAVCGRSTLWIEMCTCISLKVVKELCAHLSPEQLEEPMNDGRTPFYAACANGYIDISTVMTNYIRIWGKNSSTMTYSAIKYKNLMECFAMQFKEMFYDKTDSIFAAKRFLNLTRILETIANN